MTMNPYELLGVDLNADYDEIGEHYNAIVKELSSGAYHELYAQTEALKLLQACKSLCTPSVRSQYNSMLTRKEKKEISENAGLFNRVLRMNRKLEGNIGKQVAVSYRCYDFLTFETGELKSVKPFDELVVDKVTVPFIGPECRISKVINLETEEILYNNNTNSFFKDTRLDLFEIMAAIAMSWGTSTAQRQAFSKRMMEVGKKSESDFSKPIRECFLERIEPYIKPELQEKWKVYIESNCKVFSYLSECFRIIFMIEELAGDQSIGGYKKFAEEKTLTATEIAILNYYYIDGDNFRECWKKYSNGNTGYTFKSKEYDDSDWS